MLITKIKLFLKSQDYRKLTVKYFFAKLIHFVKLPFMYLAAFYKVYKLQKNPDRWEQHVAFRSIVNDNEQRERNKNKVIVLMNFTGAISRVNITMLAYGDNLQRDDATEEQFQELRAEFDNEKSEILEHMHKLEEMEEEIPEELKQMILETKVDEFLDFEDYELYTEKMRVLLSNLNINYE